MYVLRVHNMNFSAAVQKAKARAEEIKAQEEEEIRDAEEKTRQFANSVAEVPPEQRMVEAEQNARRVARGVEPGTVEPDGGSGAFGAIMTFVFGEHWFTYSSIIAGVVLMLYVRTQLKK